MKWKRKESIHLVRELNEKKYGLREKKCQAENAGSESLWYVDCPHQTFKKPSMYISRYLTKCK